MHFALGRLKGFRYGYVTVITRYTHYDTLGVSKNATHERIKAKYYELSKVRLPQISTVYKCRIFNFKTFLE